jgi:hypothetical protein
VDGLAVDYEGVLPTTQHGRRPEREREPHRGHRSRADAESPNGLETIVDGYRGATADAFAYSAACSG